MYIHFIQTTASECSAASYNLNIILFGHVIYVFIYFYINFTLPSERENNKNNVDKQ